MHEFICITIQAQQHGSHLLWHLERAVWSRWWGRGEKGRRRFGCLCAKICLLFYLGLVSHFTLFEWRIFNRSFYFSLNVHTDFRDQNCKIMR